MHKIVMFIPLAAALVFSQTGVELIGVVFNKENLDAVMGVSSSTSRGMATDIAKGLGVNALSIGQIGAAVVATLIYCACIGYSSAMFMRSSSFGPVSNALILLAGSLAGPALHARLLGQFDPKSIAMLAVIVVGASLVLLAVCTGIKLWLDDDAGQGAAAPARPAAGDRIAAIAARKPQ